MECCWARIFSCARGDAAILSILHVGEKGRWMVGCDRGMAVAAGV